MCRIWCDLIFANLHPSHHYRFTYFKAGYGTLAFMIIECSMFASAVSIGIFALMMAFPGTWLRSSLTSSLNIILGILVLAFLREDSAPCITLLVIFVLCLLYCAYSWKRLPVSIFCRKKQLSFDSPCLVPDIKMTITTSLKNSVHCSKLLYSSQCYQIKYCLVRGRFHPSACSSSLVHRMDHCMHVVD
jgi:hypothetical protein